jgi:hypothetical protein
MKNLILKHKSLLGGYERMSYLADRLRVEQTMKGCFTSVNLKSEFIGEDILRTRKSISRLLVLTNHINNNY